MTLVIPVDYAQVRTDIGLTGDNEPMSITYAVSIPNLSTTLTLGTIPEDIHDAFVAAFGARLDASYTFISTEVKGRYGAGSEDFLLGTHAGGESGTRAAFDGLPQNCALLVHKRTNFAGRTGRGRNYFPGLADTEVNEIGQITAGVVTAWQTAMTAWLAGVNAVVDVGSFVLLHNTPGAGAALAPREVTALTVDPLIATQRRRLRK